MNRGFHLSVPEIVIGVVSIANVCLLVTAAFYREGNLSGGGCPTVPAKLGYVAVGLGLCSQFLYGLMVVALAFGWTPELGISFNHLELRVSRMGLLLSAATLLIALFGKGLRRIAGVWVGVTTWLFWDVFSFGAWLRSFPN